MEDFSVAFCVVLCEADFEKTPKPDGSSNSGRIIDHNFSSQVQFFPDSRRKFINCDFLPLVEEGVRLRAKEQHVKTSFVLTRETGLRLYAFSLLYTTPLAKSSGFHKLCTSYPDASSGLYEERCVTIISLYPLHSFIFKCLDVIKEYLSSSSSFHHILHRLLLPSPSKDSNWILLRSSSFSSAFYLPPRRRELPLFNVSIKRSLFDEVGLDNSVSILSCCLTEKYVLFKSEDASKLVPACEAVTNLLYPFQWQLAYIPHLPAAHAPFMDMPQIYIIGVVGSAVGGNATVDQLNKALFCIVDLDSGVVNWPEDLTPLPDRRKLITRLQNRLAEYYTSDHSVDCEFSEDLQQLLMNNIIRETVLEYMLKLISGYSSYTSSSHSAQFDHMAFLSERASSEESKFLSDFVQTQMFATFLDHMKSHQGSDFYSAFKDRLKDPYPSDDKQFVQSCVSEHKKLAQSADRLSVIDCTSRDVTSLDDVMNDLESLPATLPVSTVQPSSSSPSVTIPPGGESGAPLFQAISPSIHQPADISTFNFNNHKKIIIELLQECKTKTKKLLLVKLGSEAERLGHQDVSVQEENTLIKGLCDLFDRIWSHGLVVRKSNSPLWNHLLEFDKRQKLLETPTRGGGRLLGSTPSQLTIPTPLQSFKIKFYQQSLMQSIRLVMSMSELKTEASKVRAWVRLAIERKVLASHIKELLSDEFLLRQLYKQFAFFRYDDPDMSHNDTITQLVYHLLTLNAVDFFSFTDNFPMCKVPYKIHVCPIPRISTNRITITITGSLNQSPKLYLESEHNELSFKSDNLGRLLTVRIGCEGDSPSSKWFMDTLLIRNSLTGLIWKFPCAQWIGLEDEDGSDLSASVDRLLFAELLSRNLKESDIPNVVRSKSPMTPVHQRRNLTVNFGNVSLPRRGSLTRFAEALSVKPKVSRVQETLGNSVNSLVKALHYQASVAPAANMRSGTNDGAARDARDWGELPVDELNNLVCGPNGLMPALLQAFHFGIKSQNIFRSVHVWDFFMAFKDELASKPRLSSTESDIASATSRFNSTAFAKDVKFNILSCFALKNHQLHAWVSCMCESASAERMYDSSSFLRDPALQPFFVNLLKTLAPYSFDQLSQSVLRGL